jgi:hypothetical protein
MQQVHGNVRRNRHAEDGDCGYQNDHSQLALDRKVREPTNQCPSRSPARFQHRSSVGDIAEICWL